MSVNAPRGSRVLSRLRHEPEEADAEEPAEPADQRLIEARELEDQAARERAEAAQERKAADRERRWGRSNPAATALWALSWAAVLMLALGMLLVSTKSDRSGDLVHAILRTGRWLATPFQHVFSDRNPDHELYENWALAGVVYFVIGRVLAWMLARRR